MIDQVLTFLKDQLNSYLKLKTGVEGFDIVFIQERSSKEVTFPKEAISAFLINIEEDRTFRSGAMYERGREGVLSVNPTLQPHLYLNLYVLIVANFTDYIQSLKLLSLIISCFHHHRLFNHHNSPNLSPEIEKLTLELINLPFEDQRDIWSIVGNSYLPSVLYKVGMLAFEDLDSLEVGADIIKVDKFTAPL
ncbi:MAG: DUF4255 domain-containing protein [Cyanobacteria bacterium P01_F01_bin.150]